jgi:hypothetical protein
LPSNHLEVIESGLFRHNRALEVIWLDNNKLHHIDPFVFSDLLHLTELHLTDNSCSRSLGSAKGDVKQLVSQIEKLQCVSFFDDVLRLRRIFAKDFVELQRDVKAVGERSERTSMMVIGCVAVVAVLVLIVGFIVVKLNM